MEKQGTRAGYALALLTTIYALGYADRSVINLLLDSIKAEFHLSDTVLGLITGFGFSLFQVTLGIPIARWADRGNRTGILTAGLVLWSGMTALCGRVSGPWQLAFARMGVGIGEACLVAPSHSLLSDFVSRERRTRAFGVLVSGADIGLILGLLVGGWVQHYWGWRAAFMVAGMPGLAVALLFRLTVREPVRATGPAGAPPVESLGNTLRFLASQRSYVYVLLGSCAIGLTLFPLQVWAPALLRRVHHLDSAQIGTYTALSRVLAVAGVITGGLLTDIMVRRSEAWRLKVPACACASAAPMVVLFAWAGSPALALLGLGLAAACIGAHQAAVLANCQTVSMPRMRALAAAIFVFSSSMVGSGVGSLLVGALSDWLTPRYGDQSLRYALMVGVVSAMGACALMWHGSRYAQRDAERVAAAMGT